MILPSAGLAFSAILRNKMRSWLTMLGIVIGVGAVVMMQSMGRGATAYVGEAISGLGSNMLFVIPGTPRGFGQLSTGVPLFTLGDLDAIRHQARDVSMLTAAGSRIERIVYGGRNRSSAIGGVMPEYFAIRGWGVTSGHLYTQEDERQGRTVCLVGRTIVDDTFLSQSPVGRDLRVRDMTCLVIGVLESKGAAVGADQDDVVFMPYATFSRRLVGNDRTAAIMAAAVSTERIDEAKEQIVQVLRRRRHIAQGDDDNFAVRDPRDIQAVLQTVVGMLAALLAGVAAVSLVVGGIGIMNIMLVSVTERTREIGIRLAIGARARDILTQFFVEATTLSALGGVLGVVLGLVGAMGSRWRHSRALRGARHRDPRRVRSERARWHRLRCLASPKGGAPAPACGPSLRIAYRCGNPGGGSASSRARGVPIRAPWHASASEPLISSAVPNAPAREAPETEGGERVPEFRAPKKKRVADQNRHEGDHRDANEAYDDKSEKDPPDSTLLADSCECLDKRRAGPARRTPLSGGDLAGGGMRRK